MATSRGPRTGVAVEGLNQTLRSLQRLGVEVGDLKAVFAGIAAEGAQLASRYAPARSGKLRSTIRGNRAKNKAVVTAGRARVRYAGPINYGWPARRIQPALFMQKADQDLRIRAVRMLDDGITDAIRRAGLR